MSKIKNILNNKGNTTIMVLSLLLAVVLLLTSVITVSARSRDVTSRYIMHASLYDMAVAGNEKIFLSMQYFLKNEMDGIMKYLEDAAADDFKLEVMVRLNQFVSQTFLPGTKQSLSWSLGFDVTDAHDVRHQSRFDATTSIVSGAVHFILRTDIVKHRNSSTSHSTAVTARIMLDLADSLDETTLKMVELMRVTR